jgi:hypothetical protein
VICPSTGRGTHPGAANRIDRGLTAAIHSPRWMRVGFAATIADMTSYFSPWCFTKNISFPAKDSCRSTFSTGG